MIIKLLPIGKGSPFTFPNLPEEIKVNSSAKYQSFEIMNLGGVKFPKGTEVDEISWSGEFFGPSKSDEPIVQAGHYQEPKECINILLDYLKNGSPLNIIITGTTINMDVTLSNFEYTNYGAYGNVKYSITFCKKKPLVIYEKKEMKISNYVKKTKPRNETKPPVKANETVNYTIVQGDTLSGISLKKYGNANRWQDIYNANKDVIENAAKKYGKSSSDKGHWIYPGVNLVIP